MKREYPDQDQRLAICRQKADASRDCVDIVCASEDVQILAEESDSGEKIPTFKMSAYNGGPIRQWWSSVPIIVDLAGMNIPSQTRPIRFQHSSIDGVGHSTKIQIVDGRRLIAEGVISRDTEAAKEIISSSRKNFPWQASIGAAVLQRESIEKGETASVNGRNLKGPLEIVRKSELIEISFVDLGADSTTRVRVAAQEGEEDMAKEKQKKNEEEVEAGSNDSTKKVEAKEESKEVRQNDSVRASSETSESVIADIRSSAAREAARINAVNSTFGNDYPQLRAEAIKEGWDQVKCELEKSKADLEALRKERPKSPAIQSGENTLSNEVLEAACVLNQGIEAEKVEKMFSEQTLELADKRFKRGIGLQQLILEAAWANGYTGRFFRENPQEVLRASFGESVQAGFSTIDIGGILSNVANKFLLEGFFGVERTWADIAATSAVSDFKTVTRYRLIGKEQYEKVAPSGEIKHGHLDEESFTNKADTYGLMLSVSRTDIVNDDLGAITTVPRKLGRGAGLKINDVFWTAFMNNSTVFTAARGNYDDGADTALSIDALTLADILFMEQTDPDGKPLGIMPQRLLVPPSLFATAKNLFNSMEMRNTTASTVYPTNNPHRGRFSPVMSAYLSNTAYTGASSLKWYLLADPRDLAVIEVVFLNGQQAPTIQSADANFNVLGIQMRGYHDFGVAFQDWRGGVAMKGEA